MSQERGLEISQRLEALESLLRARGEIEWARRLDAAVAGGATGTEILVRAGAVVRELRRSRDAKRLGIERDLKELAGLIDRQLRI